MPTVCLVSTATTIRELAIGDWTAAGFQVHVLLARRVRRGEPIVRELFASGIPCSTVDANDSPAEFRVGNLYESPTPDASDQLRHTLVRLHAQHRFAAVEFPALGGLGFRSIQAKRAGLTFADLALCVRLDGLSRQVREGNQRWPMGLSELETDFAERHSFENADQVIAPEPKLLDSVSRSGWADPVGGCSPGVPDRDSLVAASHRTDLRVNQVEPLVTIGIAHFNLGMHLPAALESIANQTYWNLDVVVIDDGSTDPDSRRAVDEAERRYPAVRFFRQTNSGIGATRNRCLEEARGEYFIPMDADNLFTPTLVERFVAGIRLNPHLTAMSCYFLAFREADVTPCGKYLHACRPTGGPHAAASIRNVYGDATGDLPRR